MDARTVQKRDWWLAPLYEGALILMVALAAWAAHQPLIFASLGPTAYELVETPERRSARPYNIIAGHCIAIAMGFCALYVTHAWKTPPVSAHEVPLARVWAAVLAAMLTVLVTLLTRATQPAATATTLLMAC